MKTTVKRSGGKILISIDENDFAKTNSVDFFREINDQLLLRENKSLHFLKNEPDFYKDF
jgi:hypothetical protein